MKPPRCRLCGKEHYGLCKNIGEPVAAAQSPKLRPGGSTPPTFANPPSSKQGSGLNPDNGGSNPSGGAKNDDLGTIEGSEGADEQTGSGDGLGNQELVAQARNKHLVAKDGLTVQSAPLTPAQRQKAYRKRGGAELREREKLRKRRKRGD